MPVFALPKEIIFPDPNLAEKDGLLAIGGDLSPERLIEAYANGIFPWYSEGEPLLWWSPDPRMILFPDKFKISKSLGQSIRNKKNEVFFDRDFKAVIENCAITDRNGEKGTWITPDMQKAYINLHNAGFAHSVETYKDDKLIGGLYGISLGKAFFGESMFHTETDASKIALYSLVTRMKDWGFHFIDVQQETNHLKSLGAETVPRKKFLGLLVEALKFPMVKGKW
ncbi:MAG: leucyl/phenylalanyl-tRNA--protein transferase [Bacteroidetes bacterium]|nr:MAG: leucyl/phenylalanyl-tRNA--protein transferase [Bacteroidota bacterium]